jgi:hypothetical protein
MSHVDEGTLHAYLDGALDEYPAAEARRVREHIEACALCATRLAEERKIREGARSILDLAAPKVEAPTFEELRAYVRAGQSKRAALGRLYKMGWAASVVLALGTGWMIRGSAIDPASTFRADSPAESSSSERNVDEAEREAQEAPTAAIQRAPEEADRDAGTDPQPSDARVAEPAPPSPAALERAAANAPAARPADGASAGAAARAEVAQASPPPQPDPLATAGTGPSTVIGQAPAGGDVATDVVVAGPRTALDDASPSAGAAPFGGVAAPPDSRQADAARVQERLDSAARAAETRRRMQADQVVTSSLDAAAPAAPQLQRQSSADDVEREATSGSLVVPGLPVLDVLPVSEGTAFAGVRALQRLASGDTLEVFHLPEGIDPSLLAPAEPEISQLVRQTPEGWLVMRAPLPVVDLERLLERLESGR